MKALLLAAAAAIAVPALAQETPSTAPTTADQTAPAGDPSQAGGADQSTSMPQGSDPSMQQSAPAGDPSMQQPAAPAQTTGGMQGGGMQGGMTASAPTDPNAADPAGGYQPATSATNGPAQPGAQVVFQPAPSPSQAFPPPPPMQKYPVCKKGQYDNCIQRGGR